MFTQSARHTGRSPISHAFRRFGARSSLLVLLLLALVRGTAVTYAQAGPNVVSDKADYPPGATVILTGQNWLPGEAVHIFVNDDSGQTWSHNSSPDPVADGNGTITYSFQLPNWFVANYGVTATGTASGTATTTFTDKPAADLDQCANGGVSAPPVQCINGAWQNGNLGQSQAHYLEGQSVPYRAVVSGLTTGETYTLRIEYDTTQSGKHALDYLTTFNRTETTADPCSGVAGVPSCAAPSTFPIPLDPNVSGAGVTQLSGQNFTLYNGTITGVSGYTLNGTYAGTSQTSIIITFMPSADGTAVLAWGGHIATRSDWGQNNSAIAISGSPYHMRLTDFTCSNVSNCGVGNQDRSLSSEAVIFPAKITIVKHAAGPSDTSFSFTATPAPLVNFTLVDNDGSSDPQQVFNLTLPSQFTTYNVAELDPLPIYALTSLTCVEDQTQDTTTGLATRTATIRVQEGESITCTFTNTRQQGTLRVIKQVINNNGGTANASAFNLHVKSSSVDVAGSPAAGSATGTVYTLQAGPYVVSEDTPPSGYNFTGFSGDCDSTGNVTVVAGQEKTCTIINDDQQAYVIVNKVVINNSGGSAAPDDFNLTLDGNAITSGGAVAVNPGTYTAGETLLSGYSFVGFSGDCDTNGAVTVALGETKTCTLTNDDQQAYVILDKVVINNNGGLAGPNDFLLTLGSSSVLDGIAVAVNPGTYTAGETLLSGYSFVGFSGDCNTNGAVTVALGETKTCTLTNDDIAPKLYLRKVVVNDNGGTATGANFTLTADGTGANDLSGVSPVDSGAGLQADTWTLSETSLAGYSASAWNCVGGMQSGSDITVGIGGEATCTITNDDIAPTLTLVKVVVNNNGGDAQASAWTLGATGSGGFSGNGTQDATENKATLGPNQVKANVAYSLDESGPSGYTASTWNCTGGAQGAQSQVKSFSVTTKIYLPLITTVSSSASGDQKDGMVAAFNQTDNIVTLALGDNVVCTITNDDIAPKLHLRKVVVNNNGGTATVANFTLTAKGTGTNDLSGISPVDSGAGLQADTWTLSETSAPGYSASDWSCVGGTQSGSNITVDVGGEATCTITNDDIAPQLHLRKVVVNDNGGTATVANFTLTANGTGTNDLSGISPVDSGAGLQADTWALSETNLYGYSASDWSCVGGTQSGSNITVAIGGEATCTITNDDQPGTIIIQKLIKPVGSLTSFNFNTTGAGYTNFSLTGGQSNTQSLNAGSYTVMELVPLGWVLTGIGGSTNPDTPYNCTVTGSGGSTGVGDLNTQTATISLKNGDTVTCVFENTGQGVTRTQGFWATHPQLAEIAWFGGTAFGHTFPGVAGVSSIGNTSLCTPVTKNIDTLGKVMGAFWSDIPKTTTGAKRSSLDQARMQLLQQLIAAELNASAFGSAPSVGTFAAWEAAYCGTNVNAIKTAQQQAASFNTSGDSGSFTPGTSADSKRAREIADRPFWNTLP